MCHNNPRYDHGREEYLEFTHSALRMMEERYNLRTTGRKRGTSIHQERLLRSSYLFNFSRLGFVRHKLAEDNNDDVPVPQHPPHDDHTYCVKVVVNNSLYSIVLNIIFLEIL